MTPEAAQIEYSRSFSPQTPTRLEPDCTEDNRAELGLYFVLNTCYQSTRCSKHISALSLLLVGAYRYCIWESISSCCDRRLDELCSKAIQLDEHQTAVSSTHACQSG